MLPDGGGGAPMMRRHFRQWVDDMLKKIRIAAVALTVIIGGFGAWAWWQTRQATTGEGAGGGLVTSVSIGGPFTLTNHLGQTVTDTDFGDQLRLIYFGYTFCPDVCPTELGNISLALNELGDDLQHVTPLLITVDPERDTPEVLRDYVPLFHEKLVGLTGSRDAIDDVAKAYRVFYRRVEDPDYTYYLMDHTSFVYLMGRNGEFLSMHNYGTAPQDLADAIRQHIPS